jgi:hypothetical protein
VTTLTVISTCAAVVSRPIPSSASQAVCSLALQANHGVDVATHGGKYNSRSVRSSMFASSLLRPFGPPGHPSCEFARKCLTVALTLFFCTPVTRADIATAASDGSSERYLSWANHVTVCVCVCVCVCVRVCVRARVPAMLCALRNHRARGRWLTNSTHPLTRALFACTRFLSRTPTIDR